MASLAYLKNGFNLSDEEVCSRWSENILWQYFSGLEYYEYRLPCDPTQIGRFRLLLGEDGLEQLLKATIDTAVAIKAVQVVDLERVIVDTTVQEKAISHPVDSRLLEIARHKVVSAAKRAGINLRQTFAKEGKELRRKADPDGHPNSPTHGHLKFPHPERASMRRASSTAPSPRQQVFEAFEPCA